jgi:nitrite reductase/ring-hydroxylating ferredoxin subunit
VTSHLVESFAARRLTVHTGNASGARDECADCGSSRRAFLGQAAAAIAAAVALELGASQASAFPVTFMSGAPQGTSERVYPIPATDGAVIDRGAEIIIARVHQEVIAFNLACPHENTALRWHEKDQRFQCPRHGSKYQPDGTFISGRATRNMDRLPIRRVGDTIVVDVSRIIRSDQQQAEWTAAVVAL